MTAITDSGNAPEVDTHKKSFIRKAGESTWNGLKVSASAVKNTTVKVAKAIFNSMKKAGTATVNFFKNRAVQVVTAALATLAISATAIFLGIYLSKKKEKNQLQEQKTETQEENTKTDLNEDTEAVPDSKSKGQRSTSKSLASDLPKSKVTLSFPQKDRPLAARQLKKILEDKGSDAEVESLLNSLQDISTEVEKILPLISEESIAELKEAFENSETIDDEAIAQALAELETEDINKQNSKQKTLKKDFQLAKKLFQQEIIKEKKINQDRLKQQKQDLELAKALQKSFQRESIVSNQKKDAHQNVITTTINQRNGIFERKKSHVGSKKRAPFTTLKNRRKPWQTKKNIPGFGSRKKVRFNSRPEIFVI